MDYRKLGIILLLLFPLLVNSMQYQIKNDEYSNTFKHLESMLTAIISLQKNCDPKDTLRWQEIFVMVEKLQIDIYEQRVLKADAIAIIKNIFLLFDKLYVVIKNKPNLINHWYERCLLLEANLDLKISVSESDIIKLINKIENVISDKDFKTYIKLGKLYQKAGNSLKALDMFNLAEECSRDKIDNKNKAQYHKAELILLKQNKNIQESEEALNLIKEIKSNPDISDKLINKINKFLDFFIAENNNSEKQEKLSPRLEKLLQEGKKFNFVFFTKFEQLIKTRQLKNIKEEAEYLAPVNKKIIISSGIDLHLQILDELIKIKDLEPLKIELLTIKSAIHFFQLDLEQYIDGLSQIFLTKSDSFSFIEGTLNNFYEFEQITNKAKNEQKDYSSCFVKSIKKHIKNYTNLTIMGFRNTIILLIKLNNYLEAQTLLIEKAKNCADLGDLTLKFLEVEILYRLNNSLVQKDPVFGFDYIKQIGEIKNGVLQRKCLEILTLLRIPENKQKNLETAQNILENLKNEKLDLKEQDYQLLKTIALLENGINARDEEIKKEDENEKIFSEFLESSTEPYKNRTGKGSKKSRKQSNKKFADLNIAIQKDSSKKLEIDENIEKDEDFSFDLYINSLLKNQTNTTILEKLKSPKTQIYLKNKIIFDPETSNIIVNDTTRGKQYIFALEDLNMNNLSETMRLTYHERIQKWFNDPIDELREKNSNDIIDSHSFCSAVDHIINIFGHNKTNKKINKETNIQEEQEMKILKGSLKKDGILIDGIFEYTFYTNKQNENILYHRIFRHKQQGI